MNLKGETLALPDGEFDDSTIEAEEANFLADYVPLNEVLDYVNGDKNTVQTSAKVLGTREEEEDED